MPAQIILNPYSNRWGARAQASALQAYLREMNYDFDFVQMQHPGHGAELARRAVAQGYDTVVAAGGDGTISEVVNGLVGAGQRAGARLGVIPLGSANDYAYQLGIPTDLQAACELLVQAKHVRTLDLGRANAWVFMNDFVIGLGAEVNREAAKISWLRGDLLYVAGALRAILKGKWPRVSLRWDDGEMPQKQVLLAYVGIGYRTGGVYFITSDAQQDDGLLDLVVADARSRLRVFTLLPKTFKGTHIHAKGVFSTRFTKLCIECADPVPVLADGELVATDARSLQLQVLPAAIQVISGATPGPRPKIN